MPASAGNAAGLEARGISHAFRGNIVLRGIDLSIPEGQLVALLGPSGSGKTTLLRLLAGLERPTEGRVSWKGREIGEPGIERGVVFQDYSLFPWMKVSDNLVLAIRKAFPGKPRAEQLALAEDYLEMVGLSGSASKYPYQLSGGMQQRGAIARALAIGSPVLLMDEPFGALDPLNRIRLQDLLAEVREAAQPRKTILFVTHDVDEAIFLGDRVVVLGASPGRVIADLPVSHHRGVSPRDRRAAIGEFRSLREQISDLYREDVLNRLEEPTMVAGSAEGI
ncbi:MAG TPA: ABC transporter ATP-binding protein [Candidatus Deferrimicrobiaceae bacterium]|jgi:NitT/TauT family transport system ATP-binding protein